MILSSEHIKFPGLAEMVTLAGTFDVTLMVMEFDVAGEPVTHVTLEVIIHVITSLFVKVVEV